MTDTLIKSEPLYRTKRRFNSLSTMIPSRLLLSLLFAGIAIVTATNASADETLDQSAHKLKLAIEDLIETHGAAYPEGPRYLEQLNALLPELKSNGRRTNKKLEALRREALLANPALLNLPGILVVQRKPKDPLSDNVLTEKDKLIGFSAGLARDIAMPSNHECNSSLERTGYDDQIVLLNPGLPEAALKTVYRPDNGGYVGQLDLDFDARHVLFTQSDQTNWKLFELDVADASVRQVSAMPDDVDCMDAAYMPDGGIVFGSTASYQSVPCWHGQKSVSNLYVMKRDGTGVRQVCFDQDHDYHPTILNDGKVLYQRWDYTGICHIFLRQLMVMNPDGTKQRAIYGSNSWYPNSLFFPRALPGGSNNIISILSGYHGPHRAGQLVLLDSSVGWQEGEGIMQRISGKGDPITPKIKDNLVQGDWPLFLHPYPLTDRHFLVSAKMNAKSEWGIYLADVFDNLVLLRQEPGYALLEPTPLTPRERPPVIPEQIDPASDDATVFIQDVYAGPGLQGVPRGTAKKLRLLAYNFGYRGLAGSDKIGYGGPWEAMQILGTVPLEEDGSANFKIPANTPVAVQVLDSENKAIQLMRSWFTAMPGERVSCVGCHEAPNAAPLVKPALASSKSPRDVTPWYGPARGFDFEREVQPVLDQHCVSCHDGKEPDLPDLRSIADGGKPTPKPIGYVPRLHQDMLRDTGGKMTYTPAYDVLIHYIRRVGIEDDVSLLTPGEYHADTSELIQLLQRGHHGVQLDDESWDRLITWIDLNGPCHGTWNDVYPIPDGAHERRMALRKNYGGPATDPEHIPAGSKPLAKVLEPAASPQAGDIVFASLPPVADPAKRPAKVIDLGNGIRMTLSHVPGQDFWMGTCEVTNEQYRLFDSAHDSRYYVKRRDRADGKGLTLNDPQQPAVRVSWDDAMRYCEWLSEISGLQVSLPTAAEWAYACNAGQDTPLSYGDVDADFSRHGNMADLQFSTGLMNARGDKMPEGGATQVTGGVPHLLLEGAQLADTRFDDRYRVTAPVGSYESNAFGLFDMHGNAAEWTASDHDGEKLVLGGSFFDRPERCRSEFTLTYPEWQKVFNVGFRVMVRIPQEGPHQAAQQPDNSVDNRSSRG